MKYKLEKILLCGFIKFYVSLIVLPSFLCYNYVNRAIYLFIFINSSKSNTHEKV